MSNLDPSELLLQALGRPGLAISEGDVIIQLTYQPISTTVLPTLAFDNNTKFSLSPLVEYGRTQAGKPGENQLVSPNFIIQAEDCIMHIITLGELFSFKKIRDLSIFLSVKDFCTCSSSRVKTYNGFTDLHLLLATIAHTALYTDKLQQAIFSL